MKKNGFVFALIVVLTLVSGCEKKDTASGSGGMTVGYVINSLNDTGQTIILEGAQAYVDSQEGLSLEVLDAQEDVVKQQDLVQTLLTKGVDAIVVIPVDTNAMGPITRAVTEANIPLIYINRNPYGQETPPEGVYFVGSEEIVAGHMQMAFMGDALGGEGNVAILMGMPSNEAAILRTQGNEEAIAENYPGISVLATEVANWQRDQGINQTENILTAYGDDLNGILANNDEMALGAVNALIAAGKKDDVIVVGIDATPDAVASIEKGELDATVLQDLTGQGMTGLTMAHDVLQGNSVDSPQWIPFVPISIDNIGDAK